MIYRVITTRSNVFGAVTNSQDIQADTWLDAVRLATDRWPDEFSANEERTVSVELAYKCKSKTEQKDL